MISQEPEKICCDMCGKIQATDAPYLSWLQVQNKSLDVVRETLPLDFCCW